MGGVMVVLTTLTAILCNDPLYSLSVMDQTLLHPHTTIMGFSTGMANKDIFTAHEIIKWLRDEGLPIAAIADIAKVERKSVYAWINGGVIKPQNQERLEKLYRLLSEGSSEHLLYLYRYWNRQLSTGSSLGALLREDILNSQVIKASLSELRPFAMKAKKLAEINKKNIGKHNPYLQEMPEVIITDEL